MKKYIIKLFPSKNGVQELLNCKETYHLEEEPKFIANGWKGKEPLYYNGGTYYFKCYSQNINDAKLFNTKKAAKTAIDKIYWNATLSRKSRNGFMPIFKSATIIDVELSINERKHENFDLEERHIKEKESGKN